MPAGGQDELEGPGGAQMPVASGSAECLITFPGAPGNASPTVPTPAGSRLSATELTSQAWPPQPTCLPPSASPSRLQASQSQVASAPDDFIFLKGILPPLAGRPLEPPQSTDQAAGGLALSLSAKLHSPPAL